MVPWEAAAGLAAREIEVLTADLPPSLRSTTGPLEDFIALPPRCADLGIVHVRRLID
jgi:hypothetical protein